MAFPRGAAALLVGVLLCMGGASAGTQKAPEITDPATDQGFTPASQPECVQGTCEFSSGSDIIKAWVGNETATQLHFFVEFTSACPGTLAHYHFAFHFKVAAKDYVAGADCQASPEGTTNTPAGNGMVTPTDTATKASYSANVLDLSVPKASIGAPGAGVKVTDLYVTSRGDFSESGQQYLDDRAPDTGVATKVYTATGGPQPAPVANATAPPANATEAPTNTTAPPSSPPVNMTAAPNATAAPTSSSKSPGLAPAVMVGVLAAVAVARRARLLR